MPRRRRTAESNAIYALDQEEKNDPETYARHLGTFCTSCRAKPGERCTTVSGKVTRWHVPRLRDSKKNGGV